MVNIRNIKIIHVEIGEVLKIKILEKNVAKKIRIVYKLLLANDEEYERKKYS